MLATKYYRSSSRYKFHSCDCFGQYKLEWPCQKGCLSGECCKRITVARGATFEGLPQYLTSKYPSVRNAARARFIELGG